MIRQAQPSDLARIREIAQAAFERYVSEIGRRPAPMDADFESAIAGGGVIVFGTVPLGYLASRKEGDALQIDNLAVDPATQSRGIGRTLLDAALRTARDERLARVTLYTNAAILEARDWYASLGFRQSDRRVEDGFDRVYFDRGLHPLDPTGNSP
ncbi:MAG: GNAT family N-acetyltransferase [Pseudomonadota bacterium]